MATTTPMLPAQWLSSLRAEEVDVREYGSWETHERDDETGRVFGPVNGVVIHHTAGRDSLALCYNGMDGLPGPLCHTHLAKTGKASMLSAGRANHGGTFAANAHKAVLDESADHPRPDLAEPIDANDRYYGIEIENLGNGTDEYTWVQYKAAVKWATAICRFHGWTENSVIGHKEGTRRKVDPLGPVRGPDGRIFQFTMGRFRADVKAALALPAGVWPSASNEEEDMPLSAEDLKKIALAVHGYKGDDAERDAYWYLRDTNALAFQARDAARDASTKIDVISPKLTDAQLKKIATEVAALIGPGVADAVADKLAKRLES